ncbi:PAAR-like domain-containing protein [Nannocystis radixulma]|uniref:DUF4150 domain-containing protein n=1 Tax=Nannocystis radixulma TaxID=2995305 RepID=A0ABT5B220_9BACT|nr:PAAR-like domain-containing protein [Nannocystis radixulma]MDC0668158.1 DUF4150 domain-containing protein [Nannocystis radixulma]
MADVFANSRSIAHKGDGGSQTCPAPDPCKTPSPGGPVPVPYINLAQNSALAKGSTSVKIAGNSIALKKSNLSFSSGDEGGTAGGGLFSSKIKGKLSWTTASADVLVEGQGVVRFMEVCLHNGNANNTGGQPLRGETGLTYGGAKPCERCGAPEGHPIKSNEHSEKEMAKLMKSAPRSREGGEGAQAGYMMGVLVCQAPNGMTVTLKAHSGNPVPGFPCKPEPLPDGNTRNCAAQRLINAAHDLGFIPLAMTEAWRGPRRAGPYKPDRHADSCEPCKNQLPQMLCPQNPRNPRTNR